MGTTTEHKKSDHMTRWTCERCGGYNFVEWANGATVYDVLHKIEASHASDSPGCMFDLAKIRITELP